MLLRMVLSVSLVAILLSCFFPKRNLRLCFFVGVAILALIPVPSTGVSLGNWLYAVFDIPAVTTVTLAFYHWIWRKRPSEEIGTSSSDLLSEEDVSRKKAFSAQLFLCGLLALMLSAILWTSETNVISFDFYRLGYIPSVILSIVCLTIVFLDVRLSLLTVVAYTATVLGVYDNFFDAALDPFLTGFLLIHFSVFEIKKFYHNRKLNPVE